MIVFASEQPGRKRIFWATSKSADDAGERATPFITVSSVLMGCQYGRDTHVARKKKAQSTRDDDVSMRFIFCHKATLRDT